MKKIIIYSQDGCPYCSELKESLNVNNIPYISRDIDKHTEEWDKITKITGEDYVPTTLIIDAESKKKQILAPDRDWEEVPECVEKIKKLM